MQKFDSVVRNASGLGVERNGLPERPPSRASVDHFLFGIYPKRITKKFIESDAIRSYANVIGD